jgi:hypothetical protein
MSSLEIKIRIVILKAKFETQILGQCHWFEENCKNNSKMFQLPTDKTIRRIYEKFWFGDELPHNRRPKKYDENVVLRIDTILGEKPKVSLTEISSITDVKRTTVFGLMHSQLGLKSYKISIHQKLFEEDYERRIQTAEELLTLIQDTVLENLIYFSDEATFHVSCYVHKQRLVCYVI